MKSCDQTCDSVLKYVMWPEHSGLIWWYKIKLVRVLYYQSDGWEFATCSGIRNCCHMTYTNIQCSRTYLAFRWSSCCNEVQQARASSSSRVPSLFQRPAVTMHRYWLFIFRFTNIKVVDQLRPSLPMLSFRSSLVTLTKNVPQHLDIFWALAVCTKLNPIHRK